jgi:CubicO group peptidase (beta-lactamase class C family)
MGLKDDTTTSIGGNHRPNESWSLLVGCVSYLADDAIREEVMKRFHSAISTLLLAPALLLAGSVRTSATQMPEPEPTAEATLDRVVRRAMETFSVPGVAVGIIKDGRLVFAKGYGVREVGKPAPVDADTLFGIASNTKAFTAAALAILADEGKLDWDDRVVNHLPQFQLADPYVTREFTIRDLLTHRSGLGLGAGDLMMWPSTDFTREEIIARLKFLQPVSSFRSRFDYDNLLYMVAGEVVAAASGMSWEDFVEQRILDRLDMTPCAVVQSRIEPGIGNIALPHVPVKGELEVVEPDGIEAIAAAGAIRCNINEMAKWVTVQLAGGMLADGTYLFSTKQHKEMWSPQTILPVSDDSYAVNRTHFRAYGLGWGLEDYQGYKRVSHTGGLLGMVSYVNLFPELNLGVIVLTNQQSGAAMSAISQHVLTSYVGAGERDWVDFYRKQVDEREAEFAAIEAKAAEVASHGGTKPSLPLSAYAGTYRDDWRGDVWIREDGGHLTLEFSRTDALEGRLEHYRNDVFIVRWNDRTLDADAFVRFVLGYDGSIEQMTMKAVSPRTDFSFDFHDLRFRKIEVATPN